MKSLCPWLRCFSRFSSDLISLLDEGWNRLRAVLNFGIFDSSWKNFNSTQFIQGFWSRQNLYNSLVRLQSHGSHLTPSSSPASHLAIIPKGYSRRQATVLSADSMTLGAFAHRLLVGLASTNTWMFPSLMYSCCWQQQALLRKKCCHSCDTDLVLESKGFYAI